MGLSLRYFAFSNNTTPRSEVTIVLLTLIIISLIWICACISEPTTTNLTIFQGSQEDPSGYHHHNHPCINPCRKIGDSARVYTQFLVFSQKVPRSLFLLGLPVLLDPLSNHSRLYNTLLLVLNLRYDPHNLILEPIPH